jgi:hypothetical protein
VQIGRPKRRGSTGPGRVLRRHRWEWRAVGRSRLRQGGRDGNRLMSGDHSNDSGRSEFGYIIERLLPCLADHLLVVAPDGDHRGTDLVALTAKGRPTPPQNQKVVVSHSEGRRWTSLVDIPTGCRCHERVTTSARRPRLRGDMVGTFALVSGRVDTTSNPQKRDRRDLKSAQSGFESQWGHHRRTPPHRPGDRIVLQP